MSVSSISTNAILSPSYNLGLPQANTIPAANPGPNGPNPNGQNPNSQNPTGQNPTGPNPNSLNSAGNTPNAAGANTPEKVSTQITQVTSQPNANGTLTVLTQFADGTSKTTIQPNPKPVTVASLFDSGNASQFATLLAAQEQAQGQGQKTGAAA
ncbi:MAG TPA: hypothetical protein VL574_06600 [Stellaceae bacterium]|nr:hypothetical protein [Stellaceae bacterium]